MGVSKRRVVHVTTAHRADDVRIFERECRSLAACGRFDVFLAAAGQIPADSGVTLIPLTSPPASRAGRFTSGPRKALGLSRALSADLWHFHDPELLPVALRVARTGVPVIWDAHEDYAAQFAEDGSKSWVARPVRGIVRQGTSTLIELVDRNAAGVIAATPTIARTYSNPRTVVVGNEARLELFAHCQPDFDARKIVFTGTPGRGHLFDEVVAAVAQIPEVHLLVAGREPNQSVWTRSLGTLGDRLTHVGWLDRAGMAEFLGAGTVGLATYADLPTTAANSPNKLFEFGAAGLPVVVTPNGSNAECVHRSGGGFVAEGFGSEAIKRAIEAAMSDRGAWRMASTNGRRWANREGGWEHSEARLLGLYDAIL